MKVAITGGGEVAYQIARELDETLDIIVFEEDPDSAARFDKLDVQVVRGSPTNAEILHGVELEPGDHFVACGESDEENIIACLAAKQACDVRTTCFVHKEEHYQSFARAPGRGTLLDIDRLISPPNLLAEEIARIVLVPRAIDVNTFLGGRIWLQEYRIHANSPLLGKRLAGLGFPENMLAVAVAQGEDFHVPRGNTVFQVEDKITFMGTQRALRALEQRFFKDVVEKVKFVTIVGGGEVGLAVARRLEQEEDLELKLIESSQERCEFLASQLKSTLVLNGDGTDLELLEVEQIYRSDVLVSVTADDETNLLTSLLGRETEIPKIITRVDKPANIYLFESVGIDVPLNPRGTAIRTVLDSLHGTQIPLLATIEQGRGSVMELTVPPDFPPTLVRALPEIDGVIIGAVVRDYATFVPRGDDEIRPFDRLLVFSTEEASETVRNFF